MAPLHSKIADSLEALKRYQESHPHLVLAGQGALGTTHTKRLIEHGYLTPVLKGWYIPSMPGQEGDSTVWYSQYWSFVGAYCESRFGTQWSLTAEQSLAYYAGETVCPQQLIVRSPAATNTPTQLLHGDALLAIGAALPQQPVVEPRYGLRLYSLAEALLFCSPAFFRTQPLNARTCLYSLQSADDLVRLAVEGGHSQRAARLVGALQSIGRSEMAQSLLSTMTRLGYSLRPADPLDEALPALTQRPTSAYSARLLLLWERMREQLLQLHIEPPHSALSAPALLKHMEAQYVQDSYHSLSIEGYRVTEQLIEQVRSGQWNPDEDALDAERRNALAARGYYQAFQAVKESVRGILDGEPAGQVVSRAISTWHFELFQPCIAAGIVRATDLIGYRTQQVYIRGSRHTPFPPDAVREAMPTLLLLLQGETDAFVRAILGHFFLVYVHPYMDGNGRTARFLMNVMLTTGGFPWTIVPVEERTHYMAALEKASIEGDIEPFARLIVHLWQRTGKNE